MGILVKKWIKDNVLGEMIERKRLSLFNFSNFFLLKTRFGSGVSPVNVTRSAVSCVTFNTAAMKSLESQLDILLWILLLCFSTLHLPS